MYRKNRLQIIVLGLILLLPILGEYSRVQILGRELVLTDLIIPCLLPFSFYAAFKSKDALSRKIFLALISFALIAIISLGFSLFELPFNQVLSASLFLVRFISYASLSIWTFSLINNQNTANRIFKLLIVSTLLLSFTGYLQLHFLPDLQDLAETQGYDPHLNRLVGSWLDPNFIGGLFAFVITLCSPFLIDLFQIIPKTKKLFQKVKIQTYLITLFILASVGGALFNLLTISIFGLRDRLINSWTNQV